ncbi:MAG: P-loop NTPase fold protein [Cyanobacteria bacterium P01_A01_bin.116]
MATRLESFREAYSDLALMPLREQRELDKLRVRYGKSVLAELMQLVEDDETQDGKTIFSGHRGCGKSTLLAEFGRQCEQNGFFVSFFSIADSIEMTDVDHVNILFSIAVNLMDEAEMANVKISESAKAAFFRWFATKTRVEIDQAEASGEVSFLKAVKSTLKVSSVIRDELKQEFEPKISELVAQINAIAAAIQNGTGKELLVIIDDMDKLDLNVIRKVYDHIKALFLPGFRIIYTTPVASLREASLWATMNTETNGQLVNMPVLKLFGQVESRQERPVLITENKERLCKILRKRIPDELIEPEIVEEIVLKSGGVLREIVRIGRKCCQICLREVRVSKTPEMVKINRAVFEKAIVSIRLDFEALLGKADYGILAQTYQNYQPDDQKDQAFLDMLHALHILEYQNGEIWYDIHPVVMDLLVLKQIVPE